MEDKDTSTVLYYQINLLLESILILLPTIT